MSRLSSQNDILTYYQQKLTKKFTKKLDKIDLNKVIISGSKKLEILGATTLQGATLGATIGSTALGIGALPGAGIGAAIGLIGGELYILYTNHQNAQKEEAMVVIKKLGKLNEKDLANMDKYERKEISHNIAQELATNLVENSKSYFLNLESHGLPGSWNGKMVVKDLVKRTIQALCKEGVTKENYVSEIDNTEGYHISKLSIPILAITREKEPVKNSTLIHKFFSAEKDVKNGTFFNNCSRQPFESAAGTEDENIEDNNLVPPLSRN